jgi:hypothetical protein
VDKKSPGVDPLRCLSQQDPRDNRSAAVEKAAATAMEMATGIATAVSATPTPPKCNRPWQ